MLQIVKNIIKGMISCKKTCNFAFDKKELPMGKK